MIILVRKAALITIAVVFGFDPWEAARAQSKPQAPQIQNAGAYTFAYFRLDEKGHRISGDQVTTITQAVKDAKAAPGVAGIVTLVFVHGWQHDADPADAHVVAFKNILNSIAKRESHRRRVIGVYVSWPAMGLFWTRRSVADRVVRSLEITKLFEHLNAVVKPSSEGDSLSRLVYIGHSFGARIVFNAVAQTITSHVVREGQSTDEDTCSGNRVCRLISGYGDLVVLVNPAFEAAAYETFSQYLGENWLKYAPAVRPVNWAEDWPTLQPPLILTVGAENDAATSNWWPRSSLWRGDADEITTLANYLPYVSHQLKCVASTGDCGCTGLVPLSEPTPEQVTATLDRTHTSPPFGCVKLEPLRVPSNSPFIVARADPRIVDDHGGIWQNEFQRFLIEYIAAIDVAKLHIARRH